VCKEGGVSMSVIGLPEIEGESIGIEADDEEMEALRE
jgi:hypothetical protein